MSTALIILAYAQAGYFVVTGVWPLVHMRSFMAVTGPKMDRWLVRTVGVLVTVIGGVIAMGAYRRDLDPQVFTLAVASAAGLAAVDVTYVAKRVLEKIYLLDAAAEVAIVLAWLVLWRPS
ncbi:MAG TPA: hypothetical protein VER17_06875 [Tepidisphaeraceae bacterium]|nr:hypothetical protein [Tepidisphaeraceae bacterium]